MRSGRGRGQWSDRRLHAWRSQGRLSPRATDATPLASVYPARLHHRDFTTTLIYADYAPNPHEAELVEQAFRLPDPGLAAVKVLP